MLIMHDENESVQAMLERMQMLEEALDRAEKGVASSDDWDIIRYECGMPKRRFIETQKHRSESWVS